MGTGAQSSRRGVGGPVNAGCAIVPAMQSQPRPGLTTWLSAHGFWFILLAGFAVRLVALRGQEIVSVDGTTYIRLAWALFGRGPAFDTVQPPGYPLLIGLAATLAPGDDVRAAQWVALLAGTLLLWPFHALARRLLPPVPALLATLALALTPVAVRLSATTMSETPYVLALLLTVLMLFRRRPLAAGLCGGAALLVRPEALLVIPALALAFLLRGLPPEYAAAPEGNAPHRTPPRRRQALLLMAGFAFAGLLPMLIFNRSQTGSWQLSRKGATNIMSTNFWRRELSVEGLAQGPDSTGVTARLSRHGKEVVAHYPRALVAHAGQLALAAGPPVLLLALAGIPAAPLLVAPLLVLPVIPLFPALSDHPRFVFPIVPFLWLLAGYGVRRLPSRALRGRAGMAVGALLLAGWGTTSAIEFGRLPRNEDGHFPELRDAGLALRDVAPADALIFDRKPYTAFYARRRGHTIPVGSYDATIGAMQEYGGTYLIVADTVTPVFRPDLVPLLDDSFVMLNDPRLALVYLDTRHPRRRVAIYQFIRPGLPEITERQRRRAEELVAGIPHDPKRHGLHSDLLRRRGDYEGMCRECELLLEADPGNWRALLNLALGLRVLEREPERARALLLRAREANPGHPDIEAALRTLEEEAP